MCVLRVHLLGAVPHEPVLDAMLVLPVEPYSATRRQPVPAAAQFAAVPQFFGIIQSCGTSLPDGHTCRNVLKSLAPPLIANVFTEQALRIMYKSPFGAVRI